MAEVHDFQIEKYLRDVRELGFDDTKVLETVPSLLQALLFWRREIDEHLSNGGAISIRIQPLYNQICELLARMEK